jgi:PRC-barrel domain
MATAVIVTAAAGMMSSALAQVPDKAPEHPGAGRAPTVSSSQVIGAQAADEWLASQLRGTAVVGADNQRIGEVVDVLLDRSGKARAFVVGMGGVMGLGAKEIAIDLSQFHDMPAAAGTGARAELKVPLTRDQLAAVPEFKSLPVPDATTGAAPPSFTEQPR